MTDLKPLHIIGGGLAGSEAAWQAANCGVPVVLHEMRPVRKTDAHATDGLAELVCSNSFRSNDEDFNAVGLLHSEMRLLDSLIMKAGDRAKLPAGGALAVDRELFSQMVTKTIEDHPLITIKREEISDLPMQDDQMTIVATGPLTSEALSQSILSLTKNDALSFFDAIAPIIHKESIDFDKVWFQSRYDKKGPGGTGADYINCPMNKEQYTAFITALLEGEKTDFKQWEENTPYFDGCLPIEVMAERGFETLRFGPMKPVGLTNPHAPEGDLYAVVQLRQDNQLGTLWNMVGFQTKLKYGAQSDVFRMIPGLEGAEFARLGGLHRNTFLNSPELLDTQLRLKSHPHIRFAGQITGVEGYVESAAMGLMTGLMAAHQIKGVDLPQLPPTTAHGSLIAHITGGHIAPSTDEADDIEKKKTKAFQPMNVNFGLFPPIDVVFKKEPGQKRLARKDKRRIKRLAISQRARADLTSWKENLTDQT